MATFQKFVQNWYEIQIDWVNLLPEALKTKFPSEKHSNYFHFWSSYHVFNIHNMANLFPQCTLNGIIKTIALFWKSTREGKFSGPFGRDAFMFEYKAIDMFEVSAKRSRGRNMKWDFAWGEISKIGYRDLPLPIWKLGLEDTYSQFADPT